MGTWPIYKKHFLQLIWIKNLSFDKISPHDFYFLPCLCNLYLWIWYITTPLMRSDHQQNYQYKYSKQQQNKARENLLRTRFRSCWHVAFPLAVIYMNSSTYIWLLLARLAICAVFVCCAWCRESGHSRTTLLCLWVTYRSAQWTRVHSNVNSPKQCFLWWKIQGQRLSFMIFSFKKIASH